MSKYVEGYLKRADSANTKIVRNFDIKTGVLDLKGKNFTDDNCKVLAKKLADNKSIKILLLSDNNISDEGVIAIAKSLMGNNSVEEIVLNNNNIGPEGAGALSELIQNNHNIKNLLLTNNNIGDEGASAFLDSIENSSSSKHGVTIENLYLEQNGISSNMALELLKTCMPKSINLQGRLRLDGKGLENVRILEIEKETPEDWLDLSLSSLGESGNPVDVMSSSGLIEGDLSSLDKANCSEVKGKDLNDINNIMILDILGNIALIGMAMKAFLADENNSDYNSSIEEAALVGDVSGNSSGSDDDFSN